MARREDVLRRVLELDELDDLNVVADGAEKLGTGSVRHLGGEPLAQGAVAEERIERRPGELREQLVLAARHREDHRGAGAHGAVEGVVGGGIAGVEADDEVDPLERGVAGDVADLEPEAVGAERAGERLAVLDDIGLEVETDDLDLAPMDGRQQVVEREREIRLAGPEVDDAKRASAGRAGSTSSTSSRNLFTWRNLSKRCARTLPSAVITPSSTRNGTGTPSGSRRCLTRSCPSVDGRAGRRSAQDLRVRSATAEHLPVGVGRLQQALPELAVEQLHEAVGSRLRKQVLVARATRLVGREAVPQRAADRHRCDGDARRRGTDRSAAACSGWHR